MQAPNLPSQKLPPQNLEAEQCVLGAVLIDTEAITKVLDVISEEHFYREAHRKIFRAAIELFEKNEPIDLVTLAERLTKAHTLEEVGGASYLATLADSMPTAANILHYARIVKEKATLRSLIGAATEIATTCYENVADVDDLLDRAEQAVFDISDQKIRPGFISVHDLMFDSISVIEKLIANKDSITGVPTGFKEIDEITTGLQPSDLIIVAARPSMGKTALCLNIAEYVGVTKGLGVAIFSLEMSKEQLGVRMLCSKARLNSQHIRSGKLKTQEWPQLTRAAGALSEAPIYIDDSPGPSALEIRAKCRRLQREMQSGPGLSLVIIDYLQLIRSRGRLESRQQEISDITRSLKSLAKELNIPLVALSQLSSAVAQRTPPRPMLSDLRESGAIEQDADVVMFIYRDDFYNPDTTEDPGTAEIIISKQRNGPTGIRKLTFLKEYAAFKDQAKPGYDQIASHEKVWEP